ncbi:MAG: 30S ribosomal protein S1 [SAR86 cluster bacterium]|nr:30S ribosomal protein S1 [SAR86 cluster bacterium]
MALNFEQLLDENLSHVNMKVGSLVTGIIISIEDNFIILHLGLKSEAIVPSSEFLNDSGELDVNIGDEIQLTLEAVEDGYGYTRVSREKAIKQQMWEMLTKSFEENTTVKGLITASVKGGMTVDLRGIRAFLPGSLADVIPSKDLTHLEGNYEEFKVIKIDKEKTNIVLSRKAVLEGLNSKDREDLLASIEEGSIMTGVVKNLTDYGAFIDLGGLDGLLHITDISWSRISHPSEALNIGDSMEVKVIKFDREKGRVSLGLKQLQANPWDDITSKFSSGDRLKSVVTNIADYGFFAEIFPGVEGLVHVSEIDWRNKNIHPSKVVELGQEVEVIILDLDSEKRRISLGMKQLETNPWEAFSKDFSEGDKVKGKIKSITEFGVFIGLDNDIDGLIHVSDLAWSDEEDFLHALVKDQELEAVILSITPDRERVSLGIKQLRNDPFSSFAESNPKGTKVDGTIKAITEEVIEVELSDSVHGILQTKDLKRANNLETTDLKVGSNIVAIVAKLDSNRREIILSVRALEKKEENEALIDNQLKNEEIENASKTTIGKLIQEELDD